MPLQHQFVSEKTEAGSMVFTIGAICLALDGVSVAAHALGPDFAEFQSKPSPPNPHIRAAVTWADRLRPLVDRKAFESGGIWDLFHADSDFIFDFTSPVAGPYPYRRIRTDQAFNHAEVVLSREALAGRDGFFPLEYPADELLFTNHLAFHGLGVEVHGCGLIDSETGAHLLLGHSGAGKSTTARLWKMARNSEILSDDRIILRIEKGELWMYGTPWHGEAAFASAHRAKLKRILILQHGKENRISALPPGRAVGEIFARSFPPFHSAIGLERTIEFLSRAVSLVPCYQFGFTPDARSVEAVLRFHE